MDDLWIEPDTAKSLRSACVWEGVSLLLAHDHFEENWRYLNYFLAMFFQVCVCIAGECAFPEAAAVQAC